MQTFLFLVQGLYDRIPTNAKGHESREKLPLFLEDDYIHVPDISAY